MQAFRKPIFLIAFALVASLLAPIGAVADDDDDERFGVWIYPGTVEEPGDSPLARLGSLEHDDDLDDLDDIDGFDLSAIEADQFWEDEEDVDFTIEELTAKPHTVIVRAENSEDSDIVLAGLIEGDVDDRGELTIWLEPVDDSGFAGIAHFDPDEDDDDDDTDVTVVVWEGDLPVTSTPAA